MDQSYMHVKWMKESDLEDYSYKAKQKIRRYWGQKEKKRFLVSFNNTYTKESSSQTIWILCMMFDSRGTMIAPLVLSYMIYIHCANQSLPIARAAAGPSDSFQAFEERA